MIPIEIDFDVFKKLTSLRENETDSYNDVLRRVLKFPPRADPNQVVPVYWDCRGGTILIGAKLRARYKGATHHATVTHHGIELEGKRYGSPSEAAGAVTGTNVNGWHFWECQLPGETNWRDLSEQRRRR